MINYFIFLDLTTLKLYFIRNIIIQSIAKHIFMIRLIPTVSKRNLSHSLYIFRRRQFWIVMCSGANLLY